MEQKRKQGKKQKVMIIPAMWMSGFLQLHTGAKRTCVFLVNKFKMELII